MLAAGSISKRQSAFVLLGAGFETPNLGVSALASGALAGIMGVDPNAKILIGDYSKQQKSYRVRLNDREFEVPLLAFRFSWRLWLPNNIFRLLIAAIVMRFVPSTLSSRWLGKNRWLSTLNSAKLVFAVNGGDSFSDIYGLRRLLYVLLPQFLVLQLGRPLVLLPQTYGPFRTAVARRLARWVLDRASVITTRGLEGDREVRRVTHGKRGGEFAHDMAFLMPCAKPTARVVAQLEALKASPGTLVGLNISGLLWIGGYTRNNDFGVRCNYRVLIEQLVAHLTENHTRRILLIPHVYGEDGEGDVSAIREFAERAPQKVRERLDFVSVRLDQNEIKWVIGQCDFFIGSRMHACIAALSQCVPAVGLAYSGKFSGVFRTIGADNLSVDLRENGAEEAIALVDYAYRMRQEIRENLAREVPKASATLSALFARAINQT